MAAPDLCTVYCAQVRCSHMLVSVVHVAEVSAAAEPLMPVARPVCFAQKLTNVRLAVDMPKCTICMLVQGYTCVHTRTLCCSLITKLCWTLVPDIPATWYMASCCFSCSICTAARPPLHTHQLDRAMVLAVHQELRALNILQLSCAMTLHLCSPTFATKQLASSGLSN